MSDAAREEYATASEPSLSTAPLSVESALRYFDSRLSNRRLMRVLAYIDANIGEPITLANLAATAGLSRMYFARQFRAATGIRPHEYVLRKRIERAQQLLTATSDALVDIALNVGFQTQAHFTTVFKKIVGNTPRQWRRGQPDPAWSAARSSELVRQAPGT
jgi:AraC family transcriptional regulator